MMKENENKTKSVDKGIVVGIDLGTTNSAVAILYQGDLRIIPPSYNERLVPSAVAYTKNAPLVIGKVALEKTSPSSYVITSTKKYMGRRVEDLPKEIQENFVINDEGEKTSPIGVAVEVLKKLKQVAEKQLGEGKVTRAVITVPASFKEDQKIATKTAGELAGFKVERIINEPTAAGLAYGFKKKKEFENRDLNILVYDFGGGTFDTSILHLTGEGIYKTIATDGNNMLGGDDIDKIIISWLNDNFVSRHGIDLLEEIGAKETFRIKKDKNTAENRVIYNRLRTEAEKLKIQLSANVSDEERKNLIVDVEIPFLYKESKTGSPLGLSGLQLSYVAFEEMIYDKVEETFDYIDNILKEAAKSDEVEIKSISDINKVILVGGSSLLPLVEKRLKERFSIPNQIIEKSIDPSEIVALGAAVQGAIISKNIEDIILLDVVSLSLGIITLGGVVHKFITRNTAIPCQKTISNFTVSELGQTSVIISIVQGEEPKADHPNNKLLGHFELKGLKPVEGQDVPLIDITFKIDVNGLLSVYAKDRGSGEESKLEKTSLNEPTKEEIERIVNQSKENEEKNKAFLEQGRLLNEFSSAAISASSVILKLKKENVPVVKYADVEKRINELKLEINTKKYSNNEEIQAKTKELNEILKKLTTILMAEKGQKTKQKTSSSADDKNDKKKDDVIEVEPEEKK